MEFTREELETLLVCLYNEKEMVGWSVLPHPQSVADKNKTIAAIEKLENKIDREITRMDKLSGK